MAIDNIDKINEAPERESMEFDVLIVGGGPAGLSAAIRLKQLAAEKGTDISVCLIDKGAQIGAHVLSGAVIDPRALDELLPDWQQKVSGPLTPVNYDRFLWLKEKKASHLPLSLLPKCLKNDGNFIGSLGQVSAALAVEAERLGVDVFAGFAAVEVLFDETNQVIGVTTGDMGLDKSGNPTPMYQPGMNLLAKMTFFAEGCRGQLGKQLINHFNLSAESGKQTYGLGIKEIWQIPKEQHQAGLVVHSVGWPLDNHTYGGGFAYHYGDNLVAVGLVVGLNYENPYLSPFDEFQRLKTHPAFSDFLSGGERISYGARTMVAGGLAALPELSFPGGVLIGDDAGFLNAARIKGTHCAVKSGALAAEAWFSAIQNGMVDYLQFKQQFRQLFEESWLYQELYQTRNFKPYMKKGLVVGSMLFGAEQLLLKGRSPWTLKLKQSDHEGIKEAKGFTPIDYLKPDGKLIFDKPSSVFLSNTNHEEEQPCHLKLADTNVPIQVNLMKYAAPETRYCPAGVYEIIGDKSEEKLQINAQNCLHCKACDIKDPLQNITWTAPQGGEGPIYQGM
ncbi:TPA: electron transfer flavoprotein-ubiquinone oxidoreductase [Providencia rettgeri]|uniref:electron transfer flavoprotein-ubiquinone oxidoreductase n=1 Tax=Providencia TaxID=586 RepID=UPI001B90C4B2|nr:MULTISPECIES: electron transfer flavoprotein-ubiquinone oxidoreductase [Providencia]EMB5785740.1 electron transfer flavoprotein-ubiquinone oxidoreductase [Providencia rettgeri]MDK7744157.1 electron transfer flavoprotein-ubiquinone oxidoreductase [Providencia rettgeri]MDK7756880.1 electron transfer flavoprotein-ubiquinone oxidoreductase [Providencia rettgeri]HBC7429353.1 electron transfer flavoprotein-ubiquinone oxidoreductase [Providencia rettgeri]